MPAIAVVHLVRRQNGLAPLQRFLESYRHHAAGAEHEFIVLCKGFGSALPADCAQALDGIAHQRMFLPDRGFDLEPYFAAVARFDHQYFCFLNSYSRILAPGWLAKLHAAASTAGVGLVGATASWQSFAAAREDRERELAARGLRERLSRRMRHIAAGATVSEKMQRAAACVLAAAGLWDPARHFPPFPNYHVRTNAFMAPRGILASIRLRPIRFKLSAFALESGNDGLTRQVLRVGLSARVVDRHGTVFDKERWHLANTYRQSRQEDLLVADNQTDAYAGASAEVRAELSRLAWGRLARPA